MALATVGTVIAFIVSIASRQNDEILVSVREAKAQIELAKVQRDLEVQSIELNRRRAQVEGQLAQLNAQLASVVRTSSSPSPARLSAAVSAQLAEVQKSNAKVESDIATTSEQLKTVEKRLKEFEAMILTDATKALSVPLLQRDVQALGQQVDRGLASAKADSDRIYDLMKWVLGLMGAVSLSLVGTAVGSVFKKETPKGASAGEPDRTFPLEASTKVGVRSSPADTSVEGQRSDA